MIIILEGCDCVGKTTFAEMLSKKTGYEIVKGSSFEISELGADGMFNHMMELLDRDNIIIDRFFYSNLVYGKIYNYPMMSLSQYMDLTNKLNKKALVLYLQASPHVIAERMAVRGDDMIKADSIGTILHTYIQEINGIFMPKLMLSIDTTMSNFDYLTNMVKGVIEQESFRKYIETT